MGPRRRFLLVQPLISAAVAFSEALVLLSIIQLLLELVQRDGTVHIDRFGINLDLAFYPLAWFALGVIAVAVALRALDAHLSASRVSAAVANARNALIESWFDADWQHIRAARLGRLQQLLGMNSQQVATPVVVVTTGLSSALSLLMYAGLIIATAPLVALIFGGLAGVSALTFAPLRRRSRHAAKRTAALVGELQLTATSYAHLNRELHVFGTTRSAIEALGQATERAADSMRQLRMLMRMTQFLYQHLLLAGVIGVVVVVRMVGIQAAPFGAAAILAIRGLSFAQGLANAVQTYTESRPYIDELVSVLTESRRMARPSGGHKLTTVDRIELEAVTFSYDNAHRALDKVTLKIEHGEWVGVVGRSGSGKSTLANLLVGLQTPQEGRYLVSGRNASEYTKKTWTKQFALVSQDPALLRATVAENISFHRDVPEEDVLVAAELAAVRSEIEQLPQGFQTQVGDGHSTLSGGQRQRIALARALLDRPSCLILDEVTSALDRRNEALVEAALSGIPAGTIVIVISHRAPLLRLCHRCIAIDDGKIVAAGKAEDFDLERYVAVEVAT